MADPTVIEAANAAVISALAGPRKVRGDAGWVEQFPLSELIAAANYVGALPSSQTTSAAVRRGLRFNRLIPNGTVQDSGQRGG